MRAYIVNQTTDLCELLILSTNLGPTRRARVGWGVTHGLPLVVRRMVRDVLGYPLNDRAERVALQHFLVDGSKRDWWWTEPEVNEVLEDVRLELGVPSLTEVRYGIV